jgi:hypothetical protein
MFDEAFIDGLPDNPALAGKKICDQLAKFYQKETPTQSEMIEHYEEFLKALALLQAFAEARGIDLKYPSLSNNIQENIELIIRLFTSTRGIFDKMFTVGTLQSYKSAFEKKFGKGFFYEFSDGDLKRIQELINQLRDLIVSTKELDDSHKSRLMKRLEGLQSDLHKKVSDLDRFWGFLVDASIVLKKVGENAKPIVDCVREILDIIWRIQARAEELPSNMPLELPPLEGK